MKHFLKYPFTALLLVSSVALILIEALNHKRLYQEYISDTSSTPKFCAVFDALQNGIYPWSQTVEAFATDAATNAEETKNSTSSSEEDSDSDRTDCNHEEDITGSGSEHEAFTDSSITAETSSNTDSLSATTLEFTTVTTEYFEDALFIGDSRTVGLSDYSGWDNATYYADVGMSIYDIFDRTAACVDGKQMTILDALNQESFGKIYICLGINELGTGDCERFAKQYNEVLEQIHELQPDAILYIESIMNVSQSKSDSDDIYNNKNIKARNKAIKVLANGTDIFYLNINKAVTDDTGAIPSDYTYDGVHLKASYYHLWTDYLLDHAIVKS